MAGWQEGRWSAVLVERGLWVAAAAAAGASSGGKKAAGQKDKVAGGSSADGPADAHGKAAKRARK